jgi:RNA-directed DNA polymerase
VLANLFMHYAFDKWLEREFPAVKFERYADDAVVHCATERQANEVLAALEERMAEIGLQLHPDKTRIVFCKDGRRRYADCEHTSFTFLGYTFPRQERADQGRDQHVHRVPARGQQGRPQENERGSPLLAHPPAHRHGTERPGLVDQPRRQRVDDLLRVQRARAI